VAGCSYCLYISGSFRSTHLSGTTSPRMFHFQAMMPVFSSVCSFSFLLAVLSVGSTAAQDGGSFATLDIDLGSSTSRVWGRYVVRDRTTVRAGWMNPQDGEHIYKITKLSASSTSHARGVVYSPRCALQTFDIAIQDVRSYRYSFPCEAISQVEIHGSVPPLGRLYAHDIRIEAKYVADWVPGRHDHGNPAWRRGNSRRSKSISFVDP
jgi:hypothetical protein